MESTPGRGSPSVGLLASGNCLLTAFDALHVRARWHLILCNVLLVTVNGIFSGGDQYP
ncbi:MAG: hypothetical protein M0R39_05540 [Prolixibacteraceae bacterium]|nr:hypothetical protein [Prolixibacteraceae bacterium]